MEISRSIIERCKDFDRKAQHILYNHYSSMMYGVCLRYYPNPHIASDILQDGFIKIFENIKAFRFEGSFEGWVRRIMVNTALEYHRKRSDDVKVELNSELLFVNEVSCLENDYKLLLEIVAGLPQQYRLVFNLYAIEGYSHAEIATLLSISESTSKSNYSRARALLREKIVRIDKFHEYAFL